MSVGTIRFSRPVMSPASAIIAIGTVARAVPQFRIGRLSADQSSKRGAEWAKESVSATVDAPTIARGSAVIDS